MNTELRKNSKNDFQKYFFKLMDNVVFWKTMKKHRAINLVTTGETRVRIKLSHNKFFENNLLAIEMKNNRNIYE